MQLLGEQGPYPGQKLSLGWPNPTTARGPYIWSLGTPTAQPAEPAG